MAFEPTAERMTGAGAPLYAEQAELSHEALSKQDTSTKVSDTVSRDTYSGGTSSNQESSSNQDSTSKKAASSKDSSSKDGSSKDGFSKMDDSSSKDGSSKGSSQKDDASHDQWRDGRDDSEKDSSEFKDEVFSNQQDSSSQEGTPDLHRPAPTVGGVKRLDDARSSDTEPVLEEWQQDADAIWVKDDDAESPLLPVEEVPPSPEEFQSLLVMNINQRTTVQDFVEFLDELGYPLTTDCIYMIHVPCSRKKLRARGFAVVHCASREVAARLRDALDGRRFPGHRVFRVQVADRMSCSQVHEVLSSRTFPAGYVPALARGYDATSSAAPSSSELPSSPTPAR